MANNDHLQILKRGVAAWNEFRWVFPRTAPDLSGADLSGLNLRGIDFSATNLANANVSGACLQKANLTEIEMEGANAIDGNFDSADFLSARLENVNFSRANFWAAIFTEAKLRGSNFTHATLGFTRFGHNDLSAVKGLETVEQSNPSYIDIETIFRSHGQIPESFLRNAGIPESFIVNIKALVGAMNPIQFYSCFISYSIKDRDFAERLHADLQIKGVRCWFAPEDLKIGDKLRPSFEEAIRVHDKLMVVISESSVESAWVEEEVETAFEKERQQKRTVLFPIRLDDAVMETQQAWAADIRRTRYIGDFREWKNHDIYKKAFDRLLRDLKADGKSKPAAKNGT